MKRLTVRELYVIAALLGYGALVFYICSLPWHDAITGLCAIAAFTPLLVIIQFRK